tara:strand:- start:7525 stop:9501 length:1977 start_codon:yes stop_codon:yes gene_type:complete
LHLDKFLELRHLTSIAPHPGGESVAVAVARLDDDGAKRTSEVWSVSVTGTKEPVLLVGGALGAQAPAYDEAGRLYVLSSRPTEQDDAKEIKQVWRLAGNVDSSPGTLVQLTDEPLGVSDYKVRGTSLVVLAPVLPNTAHAEQRAVYREREKNGPTGILFTDMTIRSWDRWHGEARPHFISYNLLEASADTRRDLCPGFDRELDGALGLGWDLSPDGQSVASECYRFGPDRLPDTSILVIDIGSGAHRQLGREDGLCHDDVLFSPSGATIATTRHRRQAGKHGALRVVTYDAKTGVATERTAKWEASPSLECFFDEKTLLLTTPMAGHAPIYELSLETNQVRRVTSCESAGSHSQVRRHADHLIGIRSTFARAPELFRMDLPSAATEGHPTLCSSLSGMRKDSDVALESLECSGAGGTPIQYFFLAPKGPPVARPTVLWIHGGPVSSWTDGWHWRWNPLPLIEAGYNIVCPNPRGSTGFGQQFIDDIVGNEWGNACFEDLMAVTDAICDRDDVDSDRVAAMGGSFGGYMSNWIGCQTERFCAIVTHASLYRLSAFQGTTDCPAYWAHDMGLYPSDDPEHYDRYSPHNFVDAWKTPTLITHGEKDYRVPISQGLMLFEDLRRRNVDARLLVFPDENHWILRPRNSALWYRTCLAFLAEHT